MRRPIDYSGASQLLSEWARMWKPTRTGAVRGAAAWQAVELLTTAGSRLVESEAGDLRTSLDDPTVSWLRSATRSETDLGAHRWLKPQREESYSDWLAWVLRQIPAAPRLCRFLGLPPRASLAASDWGTPQVAREVRFGEGRLDIVVRYPGRALITVEVKCLDGEADHSEQLERYRAWMEREPEPEPCKFGVLVGKGEAESCPAGFQVRRWQEIAFELRRLAGEFRDGKRWCTAAMTLAFAGAVEQNLLGLPGRPMAGIRSRRVWDVSVAESYLRTFLATMEGA